MINFYSKKLSDDDKLLTHWLCYIMDRQTGYKRIWDVAGFVVSDLVHNIRLSSDMRLQLLNPSNSIKAYFIKASDYKWKKKYSDKLSRAKYILVARHKADNNKILEKYKFAGETNPYFRSRFYPSDYKSILCTLDILRKYDFSLANYLCQVIRKNISKEPIVPKILFALYLLTYYEVGKTSASDIEFNSMKSEARKRGKKVLKILKDNKEFIKKYENFMEGEVFKQKRAWCALRDYFKYPELKRCFFNSLKTHGLQQQVKVLRKKKILSQFELPGDVWNNNPKFRNCILKETSYESDPKYKRNKRMMMNRLLRKIYKDEGIKVADGYPEQFDVTFSFVPRMCSESNCSLCPYGKDSGVGGEDLDKICIQDPDKFCPVALICCGYKNYCNPDSCKLLELGYISRSARTIL